MATGDLSKFTTKRKEILAVYDQSGQKYRASTRPYKSTVQLSWNVVDQQPPPAAQAVAYAVARKAQVLEFFGYGLGDAIPFGPAGVTRQANEADTNQSKGRRTNGVEDMVVEALSCTQRSLRVAYAAGAYTGADASVIAASLGKAALFDPAAILGPPQMFSPFNLENPFLTAVAPHLSLTFEWNRELIEKVGTLDEIPEGAAKSFLRASGDPRNDNRYRIPEGYGWRREGEPDCEMIIRATLAEDVVLPISLVGINGVPGTIVTPTDIMQDICLRAHGLIVRLPSKN